jgi:hypothetical protein
VRKKESALYIRSRNCSFDSSLAGIDTGFFTNTALFVCARRPLPMAGLTGLRRGRHDAMNSTI